MIILLQDWGYAVDHNSLWGGTRVVYHLLVQRAIKADRVVSCVDKGRRRAGLGFNSHGFSYYITERNGEKSAMLEFVGALLVPS